MEAAVVEPLRRAANVSLHPTLVNAPLIYEAAGQQALKAIYADYIAVAAQAEWPLLLCTPTWRANRERVQNAGAPEQINEDGVRFLSSIREELRLKQPKVADALMLGGLLGCKNDCYLPEQALSAQDAADFHRWQIEALASTDIDFLIAETLPAVEEACGIAQAMSSTDKPYIISFVIDRNGCVLDGTPLQEAICHIDQATSRPPLGFMVNCVYPSFLCADKQPESLFKRLIGIQANASSLDHCELDNADELNCEPVAEWGELMLELNQRFGMKILGGCCGTEAAHLQYLVDHRPPSS